MAPRPYWKGYLKLSLVSCPVRLYNAATRSSRVSFNLLHKETHNRVQMKPHDPELGEVERSDLVKGYQFEKDQYVVVDQNDLDKIQIESSKTITIDRFVDNDEIDPVYIDSPYYLAPDGPVAEEAYTVIHEAMRRENKTALARIVLANRERVVTLGPRDSGLLMMTLRYPDEVRSHEAYFEGLGGNKLDDEMLELATQIIRQKAGAFEPAKFEDHYEAALLELVKAKIKGREPIISKAPERGKVINLMDALKRSVEASGERKPAAASKQRASSRTTAKSKAKPERKRKAG